MTDIKGFSPLWEKWEIISEIGSGLYGTVYKIKAEINGKTVFGAAKHIELLNPGNTDEIEDVFEGSAALAPAAEGGDELSPAQEKLNACLDEIETNYSFSRSKNLLIYEEHTVYEKDDKSGYDIFIRMPYCESLADILKKGELTSAEKKKLGIDICSALDDLEKRGVFHGDIKPENIFRNEKGDFLLADFGIAKKTDSIINKKAVKETVAFMAPELQENKVQKNTADIYSLGLLLYKLFNENRGPFITGNSTAEEKSEAILKRIKGVPFPAPCQADKDLAKVILIACQFAPEARWMNASAFKSALLSYSPMGASGKAAAAEKATDKSVMEDEAPDDMLTGDDIETFEDEPVPEENHLAEKEKGSSDIDDQATRAFEISKAEPESKKAEDYDNFTDPEFEFGDDEPEKKGKGKTALIIIAILIVLAALGGVIFYAISTGMPGSRTATPDSAKAATEEVTEAAKPSVQPQTTVPQTTAKPTEKATEARQWVQVPYIVGMDYSEAMDELAYLGLSVSIDSYAYSDYYESNAIIEVNPSEGEAVESGTTVSIVISQGSKPAEETEETQASAKTPSSSASKTGGYLLEGSDSRYIEKSEISSMDERTMTLALNEIYARHGRIFSTEYIAEYFNSKSWYEPKYGASEYSSKVAHNDYEDKNIQTIVAVMQEKGYR